MELISFEKKTNCTNVIRLFEYDKRFAYYKHEVRFLRFFFQKPYTHLVFSIQFVFYDANDPESVPNELFDVLIIDPPFLSEEIFTKVAKTISIIAAPGCKLIFCTGAVMEDTIRKLWENSNNPIYQSEFIPQHPRLQNDFRMFTNYPCSMKN